MLTGSGYLLNEIFLFLPISHFYTNIKKNLVLYYSNIFIYLMFGPLKYKKIAP